jgi:hypothetical protein
MEEAQVLENNYIQKPGWLWVFKDSIGNCSSEACPSKYNENAKENQC